MTEENKECHHRFETDLCSKCGLDRFAEIRTIVEGSKVFCPKIPESKTLRICPAQGCTYIYEWDVELERHYELDHEMATVYEEEVMCDVYYPKS
jgi:hypothetical protein